MADSGTHQAIIDELYAVYQSKGFILEEEALTLMDAYNLSLQEIEQITGILLGKGALFGGFSYADDDDEYDRSKTDFNKLYEDAIVAEPILEQMINDIRKIQPPQHREWMTLIPQCQAGNKYAANRLFMMYLRSVLKIAYQLSQKYNSPLMDTFEDGMEGLLKSFYKYDLSKHGVFPSYYPMWVMQNITRNMAFSPNPQLYFPVHVKTKLCKIFDNVEAAEWDLSSKALIKSVVDELECSAEEAERLLGFFMAIPSLDDLLENGKEELFSDKGAFADELARRTEHSDLRKIIDALRKEITPRESQVLDLRYGLSDGKERTLEEIGEMFSLTRERIRQIEAKGIRKLQHPTRIKRIRDYY